MDVSSMNPRKLLTPKPTRFAYQLRPDRDLWRQCKTKAASQDLTMLRLIEQLLRDWVKS